MDAKVDFATLAAIKGLQNPKAIAPISVQPVGEKPNDYKEFVELTSNTDELIHSNSSFNSFANFEQTFNLWKRQYLHPFRVASSEALREPDGTINQVFKYRYVVYHCAHYGEPRMRGVGKRPNQNYLPCGCRAMLRLNYSFTEKCLKITTLNPIHNDHEVSYHMYMKVSQKARRSMGVGRQSLGSCGELASPRSSATSSSSQATTRSNTPNTVAQPNQQSLIQQMITPAQQMLAAYHLQQQQMYSQFLTTQKENLIPPVVYPFAAASFPAVQPAQPEGTSTVAQVEQKPAILAPIPIRGSAFAPVIPHNKSEVSTPPVEDLPPNPEHVLLLHQVNELLKIEDNGKAAERLQQLKALVGHWKNGN
ncbi:unnamed protein product [Caenorhabditis angaria]|uniref:ZSWIM3 N-terminal domain-containing protein n=1 Tax=Caenorhabditis angaria TaxID=860376 RepID=A0A9P1IIH5_9PELO|nr:unnamed protein product [Caenorhabditis angaria]